METTIMGYIGLRVTHRHLQCKSRRGFRLVPEVKSGVLLDA